MDLQHPAGSVSLHHGLTVHASHGNRSARRRCGFAIRFAAAEVRLLPGDHPEDLHRPVVVRGSGARSGMRIEDPPKFEQAPRQAVGGKRRGSCPESSRDREWPREVERSPR
jgi:hypothetical protein